MPWRWLLQNWLRQVAQEKVYQAVDAARRSAEESAAADETPAAPPPPCDVATLFALGIESGGFEDRLQGVITTHASQLRLRQGGLHNRSIYLANTGVGRQAAAAACEVLFAGHRPQWLISAGFAGGLREGPRRNDIVMADRVAHADGGTLAIDLRVDPAALASLPGVHVGKLLTVDHVISSPAEKRQLGQTHEALAVDMETWAVADACRRHGVRFLAVRIITDGVDDELPSDLAPLMSQKSVAGQLGAVTGALWRRPSSAKDMWRLKEQALVASDRLAVFLASVIEQLPVEQRAAEGATPQLPVDRPGG